MVFFSAGKGGGECVDYGYKGKGVTTHLLVDDEGNPIAFEATSAKEDERLQVEPLLDQVSYQLHLFHQSTGFIPFFEADKGYDANALRAKLLKRSIYPLIPRRKLGKNFEHKKIASWVKRKRWQVERAIAWLQRKFRRLVVRWERKLCYWKGFLGFSLIKYWIDKLSG
jgi:transposase